MKQKWKRFLAGFLAILTMFSTLFTNGTTTFAASASANISFWYASTKSSGEVSELKAGYNHGKVLYAMIDGHTGYCMNFGLSADGGQLMNSYENSSTSMTAQQEKYLSYCLYYGFSTTSVAAPSNDQANAYIATQAMVWIIEKGIFGTSSADSAASKLCATAPDSTASYNYYTNLKNQINNSYNASIPSFASSTKSGAQTYELKWNESNQRFEKTFTDSNGTLGNYDFSLDGYSVDKSGNSMTIYSKKVNTTATTGTFSSNTGAVTVDDSCVFWLTGKNGYQEFVSEVPNADPLSAYMKVKTENIGYGEITKTDESSGVKLSGAVYGIYSDSGCNNKVGEMTTDGNGYAKSKALVAGTYYVKEIKAPKGYVLSGKVHTLTVKAGQTTGISATDKEQLGAITITKQGEVLTGWNGSNFTYETKNLPGATFKVTAGADIYKADGSKVYNKGDVVKEAVTTGSDGKVVVTDLHLGTYVITETGTIDGYTINTTPQTVKIEYKDQTVDVQYEATSIYNTRQKANVSVVKKDSDTDNPLDGGKYTLYAGNDIKNYAGQVIMTKGTAIQTVTTGEDGTAAYTVDLPIANGYYITETQAPYAYTRNQSDSYSFTFNYLSNTTPTASFAHTFKNDRTTAKIHLYKVDKETGKAVPQGDAKLEGAVYGLYARNDIVHPDGATGVLFKAGDLVAELTTDAKGEAEINNLYLGNYFVKEITPSEGYLLDEEEHDVVCDYENDLVAEVSRSTKSAEQVIKQPFQLIKVSDNGDDTEAPLLSGAGFTAYLKSSLSVKADGSYDFDSAEKVVIGSNGETTLLTDEKGHLVTQPIPYGTYVVIETITPHNMETVKPFEVKIVENHPTEPQVWRVFIDREFTAKLRVIKQDSKTGKTVLVPNATFKIYNLDKKEYVEQITTYPTKVKHTTFSTDADGDLILPEALKLGNYRIEEIAAPNGYVINTTYITVAVDSDTAYQVDPDTYEAIIDVTYQDAPAVGELTVEKKGEVLDSYTGGLFASTDEKEFIYKEGSLAGAEFEVYAAEDIFTNDYQLDENGVRTKYYAKGDLVATITTGEDGKAVLGDLPLGTYRVVETKAPYGYVLNSEEQTVTFAYVDDKTPVIYESMTFANDRQKISLSVEKKDSETELPIAGAVFGLYADEDIVNIDGTVLVKAGELLETAESGTDGMITLTKDYPLGKYYAKEISAPAGYVSTEEVLTFDAEYQGQDVAVVKLTEECLNTPTTFEFTKTDITSGVELSGATLTVLDQNGNVVETWVSNAEEAHVIKRLVVGETYTLREDYAPYGYLKAAEVQFTVEDTEEIQSVEMKDEVPTGTIIVNKDGEFIQDATLVKGHWYDFIFNYFKKSLAGVTFEVYAKEDIVSPDGLGTVHYKTDELVATIETNENGYASIENLPLGKYYLVETKTIEGFVLDSTPIDADVSYVDQDTAIVYAGMNVTNERQKVQITVTKEDSKTGEALEGAVFGLFAKEDILNADGKVVIAKDTQIERAATGKDGKCIFTSDLPLGKYYVKELEAPKGYASSDKVVDIDVSYQGEEKAVIEFTAEFVNDTTKVEFSKTDITGEYELAGAELTIIDSTGKVIEKWISEAGKNHLVEKLPVGKYTLREETAPYGYKIANDVEFTVEDTGKVQKVSMKDELVSGKIVINKTDEYTKKGIAGVEFEIRDADGKVIEKLVTDKDGHAESKELPIATFKDGKFVADIKYYVVETKAADGYILDSTAHEVVLQYDDDAPECVVYTLDLTNKPTEPKLPQTGDNYNPWLYAGIGVAGIALGLFAFFKKRKEDAEA
ncbi:SpaA isopeptide-forming pilin-related protein [Enterocloster bolteae]|uniref:SpaA isopeptide-forming pilin-related protein n=1 Tax=Enterocloster bolteae TaxID=208479 RepID=UPI002109C552|nr:SpaA isopeptide-forming pilin-related protein [Enterocloster bolteae]MCQ4756921.1 SpaA isopeptide-forming pilin-related protein [Enterocloster bolteae]